MSSQVTSLKEQITSLKQQNEQCNNELNQCKKNNPIIEYDKITEQMKQHFIEMIVYSYQKISKMPDRANYIANRMSDVYNKNKWSCIIGNPRSTGTWGYRVWNADNLFYSYDYKNFRWGIYIGKY